MAFNPVLRSCEEKDQIGLAGVWSFLQPAATASEVPDKVIYIRFDIFLQIDKLFQMLLESVCCKIETAKNSS